MKKCLRLIAIMLVLVSLLTYPAMAAGTETETLTVKATTPSKVEVSASVSTDIFTKSTTKYDHNLARASMVLSYAASNSTDTAKGAGNAKSALDAAGFVSTGTKNDDETTKLGFAYGKKTLNNGKTVIAVVFEDTQTKEEWTAAYDFGTGNTVQMFEASASAAVNVVTKLIPSDDSGYCFWITGFGRGGSSANLLAARLTDTYGTHSVRAYSFAAPAVSTVAVGPDDGTSKYNNLFTINNPDDIVCYLPLEKWGFSHYGVVAKQHHYANTSLKSSISNNYNTYTGKSFYSYSSTTAVSDHIDYLGTYIMPSITEYKMVRPSYTSTMESISISAAMKVVFSGGIKRAWVSPYDMITKLFSTVFAGKVEVDYLPLMGDIFAIYYKAYTADGKYYAGWDEASLVAENAYFRTVYFALKHGLGVEGMNAAYTLIENFTTVDALPFREMLVAYQSETYLAWMMATSKLSELSATALPTAKDNLTDTESDSGVTVSGDFALYDDMALSVYQEGNEIDVLLLRGTYLYEGLRYPYGPVTVTLPIPEKLVGKAFTLEFNKCVDEAELEYEPVRQLEAGKDYVVNSDNTVSVTTDWLGMYRFVEVKNETAVEITNFANTSASYMATNRTGAAAKLYLAAYSTEGQMLDVQEIGLVAADSVLSSKAAVPADTGYVRLFMIDTVNHAPVCTAADSRD